MPRPRCQPRDGRQRLPSPASIGSVRPNDPFHTQHGFLSRMNDPISKLARCAVYTRKSREYDAQRETCEAYIKSQAQEGCDSFRFLPTALSAVGYPLDFLFGQLPRPTLTESARRLFARLVGA